MMIKRKYSPLHHPPTIASRGLWLAQALLGFMGTILLVFALALQARSAQWLQAVEQQIVFEIPAAEGDEPPIAKTQDVLAVLKKQSTLENVHELARKDIEASLKGWIDNTGALPLPTMIQAKVKDGADLTMVQYELNENFPGVGFHLGRQAMKDGLQQVNTLRWAAYALVGLVLLVGAAMSLVAAYWRLEAQDAIVDLLHSMGASRTYIIRELARDNFVQTLTSAAAGLVAAFGLIALMWLFSGKAQPTDIRLLTGYNALASVFVPLGLATMAAFTTIWAVVLQYTPFRGRGE